MSAIVNNQRVKLVTQLFGKEYFWCVDPAGTWFLAPSKEGMPYFG